MQPAALFLVHGKCLRIRQALFGKHLLTVKQKSVDNIRKYVPISFQCFFRNILLSQCPFLLDHQSETRPAVLILTHPQTRFNNRPLKSLSNVCSIIILSP